MLLPAAQSTSTSILPSSPQKRSCGSGVGAVADEGDDLHTDDDDELEQQTASPSPSLSALNSMSLSSTTNDRDDSEGRVHRK